MAIELTPIERENEIDTLLEKSTTRPVVIFKSSQTCGTSAYVADELQNYLVGDPANAHYTVVTVQTHRKVSNAIAARLGVRHETPQLIVVHNKKVAWHGSHFHITADVIDKVLTETLASR
jgi:thioredoxin 1